MNVRRRRKLDAVLMLLGKEERGVAMVTVITILFVMALLASIVALNIQSSLSGNLRARRVSTALDAADAGVDQIDFKLGQTPTGGTANWDSYLTTYNSSTGRWFGIQAADCNTTFNATDGCSIGKGYYKVHVDCDANDCVNGDANKRLLTIVGTLAGQTRTIQATVQRQSPAAFDYAMFADRGIDIHHHGSSWISPTVITPKIHSNGYIKLDYSSAYRVDQIEAATSLDIGAGGGSTPGGRIPAGGYNWAYWVSDHGLGSTATNPDRCYPPVKFPPLDYTTSTWNAVGSGNSCPVSPKYSPNAQVIGNVLANQVTVEKTGDTTQPSSSGTWTPLQTGTCSGTSQAGINDPVTGVCIPQRNGDIDAGSVTVSSTGQRFTGPTTGNVVTTHCKSSWSGCTGTNTVADCNVCNQGSTDTPGSVGGVLHVHPVTWTPGTIPFPSLDYRTVYYPLAMTDQGQSGASGTTATTCATNSTDKNPARTCHVFPTSDSKDFLTYIENKVNRTDHYDTSTCTTCMFWLDGNQGDTGDPSKVQYVVLRGTYFITGGGLTLNWSTIHSAFGIANDKPAPAILIQGGLIVEQGSVTLESSLTIVGSAMDPFQPTAAYGATTVPGILAVGGGITAHDYDSDSSWTSSSTYEKLKRSVVVIRGLAYSASWDTRTKSSIPTDQHWHSYDPKNQVTIIGAQAGGKLHDCNSFGFSYDPLVKNLPGFTTGSNSSNNTVGVFVVSWKQLAT